MKKTIFTLLIIAAGLSSCNDFLEPIEDNSLSEEQLIGNPGFAEGILINAYNQIPNNYDFSSDVASDDATTNDLSSPALQIATGGWRANFNPLSTWNNAYEGIAYVNQFLSIVERVTWSENASINAGHKKRLIGEAHGLRAYFEYELLKAHAGESNSGQLLGFPILQNVLSVGDNFQMPRNTYTECVAQILSDCATAQANLPTVFTDKSGDGVNNATIGARFINRMNARITRSILAKTLLHAASPAFSKSGVTWSEAAIATGQLLKDLGGLSAASDSPSAFYQLQGNSFSDKDIIWQLGPFNRASLEEANFPPSQFGRGNTNPSQSLVDAFPMANGYPITHPQSGYNASKPYAGRDKRFTDFIVYNGNNLKQNIKTFAGADKDGINALETSTRTGYYLKKLMDAGVNLTPGNTSTRNHNKTLLRVTELMLNYAEAANEAWGPEADPQGYGFTPKSIVLALRKRAGIAASDLYVNSLSSKAEFAQLIKNERRIELSFEGFRFYDLRRWNTIQDIKKPISAMVISADETTFKVQQLESRNYADYMIYGPIPFEEVLKTKVEQNKGW